MRAVLMSSFCLLALVACGGGKEGEAATACEKTIMEKLAGKSAELDIDDMRKNAKLDPNDANVMQVASNVVFDRGKTGEYTQTFECKVRFDPAGKEAPSVIFYQFIFQ